MKLLKTTYLSVAALILAAQPAVAKDVLHSWCEEEPPVVEQAAPQPQPQVQRINLAADALFRFNGHSAREMLPQGQATLDELAGKITSQAASVDSIAITGHTDRLGSEQYNQALGLKRAETVRDYLQSKGVAAPISVASAGKSQPVTTDCVGNRATAQLKACLQPDRRVTVDITGTAVIGQ